MLLVLAACAPGGPGGPGAPDDGAGERAPWAVRLAALLAEARGQGGLVRMVNGVVNGAVEGVVDGGRITPALARALAGAGAVPPERWRLAEAQVFLSERGPQVADARLLLPTQGVARTRVFVNSVAGAPLRVVLSCDGAGRLEGVSARPLYMRTGATRRFTLVRRSHGQVVLELGPDSRRCRLEWGQGHRLELVRDADGAPALARLAATRATCTPPDPARMDALQAAFYAERWLSQTCARPTGGLRMLADPLEALNARIEALTGRRLARAQLAAGDPDVALDFSAAPRLDLIQVSYLLIRADYSGELMRRMLAWHAARGTEVRILVTDQLIKDKERALFEALAADYPAVQIQYFTWSRPGPPSPALVVDRLQRVHHMKVFATLARDPGRSRFIIGGRNIWDGFFFDHPFDLRDHPELRTYDENGVQALMYYSTYEDFEVELSDDALVREWMAHFETFWNRDFTTQVARPMAVNGQAGGAPRDGVARHFMSLPWADGQAQERYFAELIDAARREVVIVTPFMYPPPAILNALLRAQARGVRVVVVARINSTDPSGTFITALNRGFAARWADTFEVYEYVPGSRMMHTKLILIDGRLSVVTSSNMNRRSYLHDTENGAVFLDRAVSARLRGLVAGYLAQATRLHAGGDLRAFDRAMNAARALWQYF